jgi:uncharacterized paraquat-inducible protein A
MKLQKEMIIYYRLVQQQQVLCNRCLYNLDLKPKEPFQNSIELIIYFQILLWFIVSLKYKIMNIITAHPRLVTFGIGLAITFEIGTAIGMVDHNQVFAATQTNTNNGGNATVP